MRDNINPYQSSAPIPDGVPTVTRTRSVFVGGYLQAICLWGFVFVLAAIVPIFIQTWPKLPDQQPVDFYAFLTAMAIVGSILAWIWFKLADALSKRSNLICIGMYLIAFAVALTPGVNVFYRYYDGQTRIPNNAGFIWYTFRFTIICLLPTTIYAFARTKRWAEKLY